MTEDHGEARGQGQHFVKQEERPICDSALIVATKLCLRGIVASARMMQYSPRSLAKKIVSGDTFASVRAHLTDPANMSDANDYQIWFWNVTGRILF